MSIPPPGPDLVPTAGRVPTRLGELAFQTVGTGPYAVLWHSMFVDGTTWHKVVPALARHRTLVVVDGPGFGASDRLTRDTTVSESVGAATDLIRGVADGGPVDWVGNAWGGHVGLELAATEPTVLRTVVAISSPPQPVGPEIRRQIAILKPILQLVGPVGPIRSAVLEAQLTDVSRQDPELVATVVEALQRPDKASLAHTLQSFILNRIDITALLPKIPVATLLITGDDRAELTPEHQAATAAMIPDATAVVVPGARTLVPLEQPAAVIRAIATFWSAHTAGPVAGPA